MIAVLMDEIEAELDDDTDRCMAVLDVIRSCAVADHESVVLHGADWEVYKRYAFGRDGILYATRSGNPCFKHKEPVGKGFRTKTINVIRGS